MSVYNHPQMLHRTLDSIAAQKVNFPWEIIIVDDGSPDGEIRRICGLFPKVQYIRHEREPGYRNPSAARNIAYKAAVGNILICQSSDVIHVQQNTIQALVEEMEPGCFVLANVQDYTYGPSGPLEMVREYCGPKTLRPFFFLGAVWRSDLYAVGGCDEEFVEPGFDDNWLADCLIKGLGLDARYTTRAQGHHQHHSPDERIKIGYPRSRRVYRVKDAISRKTGQYTSSGGPWSVATPPTTLKERVT